MRKGKFKFYYHRHCYNTLTIVLQLLTAYVELHHVIIVLDHQGEQPYLTIHANVTMILTDPTLNYPIECDSNSRRIGHLSHSI